MNPEIQTRIDNVLKKITEPQSLLSLFDINYVTKVSYSEEQKRMLVYTRDAVPHGKRCMCSGVIMAVVREGLDRRVLEGLQDEFSDLRVEVV